MLDLEGGGVERTEREQVLPAVLADALFEFAGQRLVDGEHQIARPVAGVDRPLRGGAAEEQGRGRAAQPHRHRQPRVVEPVGFQGVGVGRLLLDGCHPPVAEPAHEAVGHPEVGAGLDGAHQSPLAVRLAQPDLDIGPGDLQRVHLVAGDVEDRLVAEVERGLVERRVEEAGDEEDAVRARDGGVEVVSGRAPFADEEPGVVAVRGAEADLDGGRGQPERLQVRRVPGLGDDALHLEVGEARRQRHDLGDVDVDGERLDDAPPVAVLLDDGAVAVRRRHRQRVDVVRVDVEHRLQGVRRPRRRPAGFEEIDVGAQPEGRRQQDQRRARSAHVVPPRLSAGSSTCRRRPPGWRRAAAAPRARRGGAARPR